MLSGLPKLADKSFIIGFFIPSLAFFIVITALFSDVPWIESAAKAVSEKDSLERLVYGALAVWVSAIVLMIINHILFQMLEGYRWPFSKLRFLLSRQQAHFEYLNGRFIQLRDEWKNAGDKYPAKLRQEFDDVRRELVKKFPSEMKLVLPTRFGNSIRAFEDYSRQIYGADSIPLWLHLTTLIPKEFQTALEDARTQVNCLMNFVFLSTLVGLAALARFFMTLQWAAGASFESSKNLGQVFASSDMKLLIIAVAAFAFARIVYELSIERVYAWGSLVKAAFDCYLPKLAEMLGYELPATQKDQRAFWVAVSRQAIFHRPLKPEEWPRVSSSYNSNAKALPLKSKGENSTSDDSEDDRA